MKRTLKHMNYLVITLFILSSHIQVWAVTETKDESEETISSELIDFTQKPSILAANYLATFWVIVDKSEKLSEYNIYDNVTRREMLKIMMNLSWIEVPDSCEWKFSDMDSTDYGCKYAEIALKKKLIAANDTFRPDDSVNQAEALKMIMIVRWISRNENSEWQMWYSTKAVELGLIDYNISNNNTAAQRRFVFLSSARTYSNFNKIEQKSIAEAGDIFDTIGRRSRFSILARLIASAWAVNDLQGTWPFTFFAPTDYAFSKLPAGSIEKMLDTKNINELREIIAFHFVNWIYSTQRLSEGIDIEAISWNTLIFGQKEWNISINDTANITSDEILTTNGSIYRIDSVIFPNWIDMQTISYTNKQ